MLPSLSQSQVNRKANFFCASVFDIYSTRTVFHRDQDDDTAHLADKGGIATESRTASCCLNLWLILFLFLLVVAVGAGYFANEETDNGIKVGFISIFP